MLRHIIIDCDSMQGAVVGEDVTQKVSSFVMNPTARKYLLTNLMAYRSPTKTSDHLDG